MEIKKVYGLLRKMYGMYWDTVMKFTGTVRTFRLSFMIALREYAGILGGMCKKFRGI